MSNSIIATTYDLLAFHKSGNDSLFDSCFEKAVRHLDVSIDEQKRKKYRNIAYHYLRTTGYLDVVRPESRWAVSPTVLVQCNESTFALVGGSTERELLRSIVPRDHFQQICSMERNPDFPVGVALFTDLVQLKANAAEAKRIAGKIGVKYSPDYQVLAAS